ncbi:MAG: hypothetical protein ACP5G2_04425 [Candidatus Bipolaricaulaceae bacterium]
MKWGGYPQKKVERVLGSKWAYYLLAVLGAALLMGASHKWSP